MNDMANHKLRWGIHKGKHLKNVPDDYLKFLIEKTDILKGKMLVYTKTRLNYRKDKYQVKVTDSAHTDGTYIVEAYNRKQAIGKCIRQHKINITV
jgi:uncharacterized protein (DUF3820 family)